MLGNLGFNKAVCRSNYIKNDDADAASLHCEVGLMSPVTFAGILPADVEYGWDIFNYGFCGDPMTTKIGNAADAAPENTAFCTQTFLDNDRLRSDFEANCQGKAEC